VVDAAREFGARVGVETADDQRFEVAQRARVEAEHVLDDVSTLIMRKTVGPERWDKLLREASASLEAAKIEETRAQTHKRVNRRVRLSDAFDHLTPEEQRGELRTLVRCVMVEAGEEPLADRVHVLPADNPGRAAPAGRPQHRPSLDSTGQVASPRASDALTLASQGLRAPGDLRAATLALALPARPA
jgi:hypothetical protein